ncbi:MAG: ClC family H(+)/Cl(-) exchange transporter [Clostridia bacterium]|nr:ClC family H(+)/Cl(-) exchange transporter [Clostridia bacterium]
MDCREDSQHQAMPRKRAAEFCDCAILCLLAKSLAVGVGAGIVVSAFRLLVALAERTAFSLYAYVGAHPGLIAPLVLALALAGLAIGWLIKTVPLVTGSGIPQTRGLITGRLQGSWWRMLLGKFFGASLITFGGLALGREGPAVQLGGCIGLGVGERFAADPNERRMLIAGGAGAGLGVALSAPLTGMTFALEEMQRSFSPRFLLSALTAAMSAQLISCRIFGVGPLFDFPLSQTLPWSAYWLLLPLGIIAGLCGVAYNIILIRSQRLYKSFRRLPLLTRPVWPFMLAALVGLTLPEALGGGEIIIGRLDLGLPFTYLLLLLAAKFVFFVVCFDSGAPGGNLFPILVLGAMLGAVCGYLAVHLLGLEPQFYANIVTMVMAGYFAAITRTPITAVLLVVEVTGSLPQALALAVIVIISCAVADVLRCRPIYDSLLDSYVADNEFGPC